MADKMFSNGSLSEQSMTPWETRVEKPAITAKKPEIECAERFYELSVGMDMNSMNGPLKDTDYPKGTFHQPITEKPKLIGSDSVKLKSKQPMLVEGEDSTRILKGRRKNGESVEIDYTEFILKYQAQHKVCFAKFPRLFKRVLEPAHDKEEVVFESLPCDYYKPAVESKTEDECDFDDEEGMDIEDCLEDECDFDDDSDDTEYNEEKSSFDRPSMIAFKFDAPLMVAANSGGYALISDLPMKRKPKPCV